ncbi:DUF4258 domain-containing protein [Hydrogenimonas sp. SS33]|uniref:DUF4258 domain-containing protein n=1 Tax=Hydrogenimonas leucolamina TaxID=2954236 RepID=UPI00336C0BDD
MESETFELIKRLVKNGDVLVPNHGYDELAEDNIFVSDLLVSIEAGEVLEDYPNFGKGPCCLVLQ